MVVNPLGTVITVSAEEEDPGQEPDSPALEPARSVCAEIRAATEPLIDTVLEQDICELQEKKSLCVEVRRIPEMPGLFDFSFREDATFRDVPGGLSLCVEPGEIPASPMSEARKHLTLNTNAQRANQSEHCCPRSTQHPNTVQYLVDCEEHSVVLMRDQDSSFLLPGDEHRNTCPLREDCPGAEQSDEAQSRSQDSRKTQIKSQDSQERQRLLQSVLQERLGQDHQRMQNAQKCSEFETPLECLQKVHDQRQSSQKVQNKRQSSQKAQDHKQGFHKVQDQKQNLQKVQDQTQSSQKVQDQRQSLQKVQEQKQSSQRVQDQRQSSQKLQDQKSGGQKHHDQRQNTQKHQDQRQGSQKHQDQRQHLPKSSQLTVTQRSQEQQRSQAQDHILEESSSAKPRPETGASKKEKFVKVEGKERVVGESGRLRLEKEKSREDTRRFTETLTLRTENEKSGRVVWKYVLKEDEDSVLIEDPEYKEEAHSVSEKSNVLCEKKLQEAAGVSARKRCRRSSAEQKKQEQSLGPSDSSNDKVKREVVDESPDEDIEHIQRSEIIQIKRPDSLDWLFSILVNSCQSSLLDKKKEEKEEEEDDDEDLEHIKRSELMEKCSLSRRQTMSSDDDLEHIQHSDILPPGRRVLRQRNSKKGSKLEKGRNEKGEEEEEEGEGGKNLSNKGKNLSSDDDLEHIRLSDVLSAKEGTVTEDEEEKEKKKNGGKKSSTENIFSSGKRTAEDESVQKRESLQETEDARGIKDRCKEPLQDKQNKFQDLQGKGTCEQSSGNENNVVDKHSFEEKETVKGMDALRSKDQEKEFSKDKDHEKAKESCKKKGSVKEKDPLREKQSTNDKESLKEKDRKTQEEESESTRRCSKRNAKDIVVIEPRSSSPEDVTVILRPGRRAERKTEETEESPQPASPRKSRNRKSCPRKSQEIEIIDIDALQKAEQETSPEVSPECKILQQESGRRRTTRKPDEDPVSSGISWSAIVKRKIPAKPREEDKEDKEENEKKEEGGKAEELDKAGNSQENLENVNTEKTKDLENPEGSKRKEKRHQGRMQDRNSPGMEEAISKEQCHPEEQDEFNPSNQEALLLNDLGLNDPALTDSSGVKQGSAPEEDTLNEDASGEEILEDNRNGRKSSGREMPEKQLKDQKIEAAGKQQAKQSKQERKEKERKEGAKEFPRDQKGMKEVETSEEESEFNKQFSLKDSVEQVVPEHSSEEEQTAALALGVEEERRSPGPAASSSGKKGNRLKKKKRR